jgi:hypothetical protein
MDVNYHDGMYYVDNHVEFELALGPHLQTLKAAWKGIRTHSLRLYLYFGLSYLFRLFRAWQGSATTHGDD